MCALGASVLIVTNAAGGIAAGLEAGALMLIEDHLNLTGRNCLVGPNDEALGPRFPDLSRAYGRDLLEAAERVGASSNIPLKRGVYAGVLGPSYETPAEVRMLRALGADGVGMSTVLEVIAARHMGVRCLGVSCVTNMAAGLGDETLTHDDVQAVAASATSRLETVILGVLKEMGAKS
jgi:purine-nucleoside phosphorylase